jgi:hypothetical protein
LYISGNVSDSNFDFISVSATVDENWGELRQIPIELFSGSSFSQCIYVSDLGLRMGYHTVNVLVIDLSGTFSLPVTMDVYVGTHYATGYLSSGQYFYPTPVPSATHDSRLPLGSDDDYRRSSSWWGGAFCTTDFWVRSVHSAEISGWGRECHRG